MTTLEELIAQRGQRAISGNINPWNLSAYAPAVQGVRTMGGRRLEDLYQGFRRSGVGGPAAGTLLEKSQEATGGDVLNLVNQLRQVPENYIEQGLQAEQVEAGRTQRAQEFTSQMAEQRKQRKLQKDIAQGQ